MDGKGSSQLRKLLDKGLKLTEMTMMKCKICDDIDYYPIKDLSNLGDTFSCNGCFFKPGIYFTWKPVATGAVKRAISPTNICGDAISDELMDPAIIISNVRSLAQTDVAKDQDERLQNVPKMMNLDPISPPSKEKMEKMPVNALEVMPTIRNAENERKCTAHKEKVSVWTAQGYLTFFVANDFEKETDAFELVAGQEIGTADDPILIDDN